MPATPSSEASAVALEDESPDTLETFSSREGISFTTKPESPEESVEDRLQRLVGYIRSEHLAPLLTLHTEQDLRKADDFEKVLKTYLKERGQEPPENVNLSLRFIEEFERLAAEMNDLRAIIATTQDTRESILALKLFALKRRNIEEYLEFSLPFKQAYQEYLRSEGEFRKFHELLRKKQELKSVLRTPAFQGGEEGGIDSQARLETVVHRSDPNQGELSEEELLSALSEAVPEHCDTYENTAQAIRESTVAPPSKKVIATQLKEVDADAHRLWEDPMVRYLWNARELQSILAAYHRGADVIETQSVIRNLNILHEWEMLHQRTTIGGVLVGPPGVGKTTLVRHYLTEKKRYYGYIDLSEDVTRYLLYGSKAIEFQSPSERPQSLLDRLRSLDDGEVADLIAEHGTALREHLHLNETDARSVAASQFEEFIKTQGSQPDAKAMRGRLTEVVRRSFRRELASEFAQMLRHSGWRDGVAIACLRREDSIIYDEFNKNKNWSTIYSLATAKPGERWYFADNDEWITIPPHWRMYFTGNVGKKHGVFTVPEALASRAGGKVLEITHPPAREEMQVALAALANASGDFLLGKTEVSKLFIVVNDVFPKIRKYVADKTQTIPISYRTIRDLAEKLVLGRDSRTNRMVYHRTPTSFDQALYDVLIESHALYEDRTVPKEIATLASTAGLLLEDSLQERMVALIGDETYKNHRQAHEGKQEAWDDLVKKIRGITRDVTNLAFPIQRSF